MTCAVVESLPANQYADCDSFSVLKHSILWLSIFWAHFSVNQKKCNDDAFSYMKVKSSLA